MSDKKQMSEKTFSPMLLAVVPAIIGAVAGISGTLVTAGARIYTESRKQAGLQVETALSDKQEAIDGLSERLEELGGSIDKLESLPRIIKHDRFSIMARSGSASAESSVIDHKLRPQDIVLVTSHVPANTGVHYHDRGGGDSW